MESVGANCSEGRAIELEVSVRGKQLEDVSSRLHHSAEV